MESVKQKFKRNLKEGTFFKNAPIALKNRLIKRVITSNLIYYFDKERVVSKSRLKKMTDIIGHRGPDDEGFFIEKNIGLGHRRLSIIDLETGDQPMFSDDKQKVLVFNGEIYNYIELRAELKKKGYQFRTNSDTEIVIKAYEAWGHDCQNKFYDQKKNC